MGVKMTNTTVCASMGKPTQGRDERRPATDKQMLDSIDASQRILSDKVRRLKRSIQSNRYENDAKFSIAMDRMIASFIR
jgi:hypothetical protein